MGQFLKSLDVVVFDPWFKPGVHGLKEYGNEGEATTSARTAWTYQQGPEGARARAEVAEGFWPALHIDLRMVDTSDFVICYCPTNIYSVGTPHEIVVARQERKPVLFVSPYVRFGKLQELRQHLKSDAVALDLLDELANEVPIKENLNASPSLWYMPLIGGEHFFDGFGFAQYRERFGWPEIAMDVSEQAHPPLKPLLPFIEQANRELPRKWDRRAGKFVTNDDWLLWDIQPDKSGGAVGGPRQKD